MTNTSRKTKAVTIALTLLLAISTAIAVLPTINGLVEYQTAAFLTVQPSTVGVGQTAIVVMWLDNLPPKPGATSGYMGGNFENFTLTITKPDESIETHTLRYADAVASTWYGFAPDQLGTYSFQFTFPGQKGAEAGANAERYYKPSTSPIVTLKVQEEPLPQYPQVPLPTDYWQRPINAQNRDWFPISGNYLQTRYNASGSNYNPYTAAPMAPHIVWTKQIAPGGLIGGGEGSHSITSGSYYSGHTYEKKFSDALVIDGKLFYSTMIGGSTYRGTRCLDLRTGEEIWYEEDIRVSLGQVLEFESPNQHGGIPYLVQTGSTYNFYDPFNGRLVYSLTNGVTGSATYSDTGDLLVYQLNGQNNWIAMYNATDATPGGTGISWRPANGSFANGLMWNKTLPDIPGSASVYFFDNDMIWARSENNVDENGYLFKTDMGINLKEGHEGEVMWIQNRTGDEGRQGPSVSKGRMGSGYMLEFIVEQMKYFGYSMQTGAKVWETPVIEDAFGQYNSASTGTIIVGDKAYRQSYDGKVRSYDLATGALVWEWYQGDAGLSSVYNSYPYYQDLGGGGGQIVVGNMEHSPGSPLPLNYSLNSIDAETGELTWSLNGAITQAIMADGYIVGINNYDNSLYAIGKGQSATTVASSNPVLTLGESTLLTGTVTDQSPGQTCLGKPAAGTPAIADEDMGAWMAYLYMQQQKPANAKGVEVTISVIDSNNNFYEVGKTTTDTETGLYKLMWEPEIPGTYTVIATFAGSESYWQSLGETAIGVIDAPEHTAAPTAVPESVADMYFVPAIAGIIVAIVIVGAVLALLLLRKRP